MLIIINKIAYNVINIYINQYYVKLYLLDHPLTTNINNYVIMVDKYLTIASSGHVCNLLSAIGWNHREIPIFAFNGQRHPIMC